MKTAAQAQYWRKNKILIAILLAIWALVSLGAGILFVVPLNKFSLGYVPFGFWMAQQGAIYVFVVLIYVYARRMDRLDHEHHLDED